MRQFGLTLLAALCASILSAPSVGGATDSQRKSDSSSEKSMLPGWEEWVPQFEKAVIAYSGSWLTENYSCKVVLCLRWDGRIFRTKVLKSSGSVKFDEDVQFVFETLRGIPKAPKDSNFDGVEIVGTIEKSGNVIHYKVESISKHREKFNILGPEIKESDCVDRTEHQAR